MLAQGLGPALVPDLAPGDGGLTTTHFDVQLATQVFAAALAFITPRTLEPIGAPALTAMGLRGLTALDATLLPSLAGGKLSLVVAGKTVFDRRAPADDDLAGWADATAAMDEAAWAISAAVRAAGSQGVVQRYFDEIFSHMDPYSRYEPPLSAESERDTLTGTSGAGIGLVREVDPRGGSHVAIGDIVPGGSGEAAGLRVGDRILAVDDRRTTRMGPQRIAGLIQGPDGTAVTLLVLGRDGKRRSISVVRTQVPPETVFTGRDGGLLLIRITTFSSNTAERLSQAIEAGLLNPAAPRALVLDLRGNRGGFLREAVTAVALVLDRGLVVSTVGRAPQSTHEWRVEGGDLTHGLPILVLVDGRTASAAEIMAAALADQRRAVVLGSSTLGKGLVQAITQLPDGGELFVTWSRVLAPLGWPIQGLGVLPQVCTSLGDDELRAELDGLADGHDILAAALAASRAARAPLTTVQILAIRDLCPAAEGGDGDLAAAHAVVERPGAYEAALLPESLGTAP